MLHGGRILIHASYTVVVILIMANKALVFVSNDALVSTHFSFFLFPINHSCRPLLFSLHHSDDDGFLPPGTHTSPLTFTPTPLSKPCTFTRQTISHNLPYWNYVLTCFSAHTLSHADVVTSTQKQRPYPQLPLFLIIAVPPPLFVITQPEARQHPVWLPFSTSYPR